jgi:hypothetical protein
VGGHLIASEQAASIGFRKYIISATTPFLPADLTDLRVDAPRVLRARFPEFEAEYDTPKELSDGRLPFSIRLLAEYVVAKPAKRHLGWRA